MRERIEKILGECEIMLSGIRAGKPGDTSQVASAFKKMYDELKAAEDKLTLSRMQLAASSLHYETSKMLHGAQNAGESAVPVSSPACQQACIEYLAAKAVKEFACEVDP